MRLGAGLLVVLAAGAGTAGWWLPAGILLAGLLALAVSPAGAAPVSGRRATLRSATGAVAELSCLALYASVFAAYLLPEVAAPAAIGFLAVVAAAEFAGLRVDGYYRRVITGLLLVAAVAFVALCLALDPAPRPPSVPPGVAGLPAAVVLAYPLFAGAKRVAIGTVAALAVAGAALYQLGPVRLGLSPTSLRDVLAAADARAMLPVLGAVVLLATVPAALLAVSGACRHLEPATGGHRARVLALVPAAVLAGALGPTAVLLVAAVATLVAAAVTVASGRYRSPGE
ncbi:hypothetical protein [Amycolatopsis cihanbeyliensis]|uniref:Uncharacterized protein n=1 Tax=Amycolatopsis cihanbeyliensis TaxID=1128664 RepID=A0A542DGG0_AMYCI|nr:hypothetical protein [Amycolatopsis cihanbeyliensis]TQJ02165.1 hypothetical protein FB471_1883 [Amycolatopsis cihanbeyliensis]